MKIVVLIVRLLLGLVFFVFLFSLPCVLLRKQGEQKRRGDPKSFAQPVGTTASAGQRFLNLPTPLAHSKRVVFPSGIRVGSGLTI